MCRLYGFRANEPTKVECPLVLAQNALMAQSREDMAGYSHIHGWGLATYPDGVPHIEKQAWAAYHGEHFRKAAARIYSKAVIAHVRRATVGPPLLRNAHPFAHGRWVFAHNGTVSNFELARERLLEKTDTLHRNEIHGSTDSEHIFRYLLSLWEHDPGRPLVETLRIGLEQIVAWCREIDPASRVSLNVLWTDGDRLVGSRLNRTLWYVERDGIHSCEFCGVPHVHHRTITPYRSVEVASEPITHERWRQIPNATVYNVDPDLRLHFFPMEFEASVTCLATES